LLWNKGRNGFPECKGLVINLGYSIKKHEVDRVMNVLVALGWTLIEERYENRGITILVHKELSEELLKAAGELEKKSGPQ